MGVYWGDTRSLDYGSYESCRVLVIGVGVAEIPLFF